MSVDCEGDCTEDEGEGEGEGEAVGAKIERKNFAFDFWKERGLLRGRLKLSLVRVQCIGTSLELNRLIVKFLHEIKIEQLYLKI